MSRYVRVATRFWNDEKAVCLSEQAKYLFLYIMTSPHSNMIGYYVLPKLYIMHDLQWSDKRLGKPFEELLQEGFIMYCEQTSVVFIPNFLKYNPIQNQNQAKGGVKAIKEIPENSLYPLFFNSLEQYAEQFTEPFSKPLHKPLPERYGNTVTVTEAVTETVTETEKDIYVRIQNLYNLLRGEMPEIKVITDKRKKAIHARLKTHTEEDIVEVFNRATESDFLSGRSGDWQANFDWLMNPNNFVKVLEGNYNNKAKGMPKGYRLLQEMGVEEDD